MSNGLFLEMVILFKCFGIFFMIKTYAQLNGAEHVLFETGLAFILTIFGGLYFKFGTNFD